MSNTKKIALMSTLVILLAITAIFNFVLAGTKTQTVEGSTTVKANNFTTYRSVRTSTRSEEFVELDTIIAGTSEGSAEYIAAVERKMALVKQMEDELVMESIIKGFGYSDAVVTFAENEHINVFVNTNELLEIDFTRICAALELQFDLEEGSIIIMAIYAES